jgi:lipoyl(octanoyl) transferase
MQTLTEQRGPQTPDEIWFLEHPPVFTLGMNAAREHVLAPGDIPLVQIDRGGQVTYHGPGQLVVYPLLDVRRRALGVRQLVMALENGIIALLASWNITAVGRRDAPGIYVDGRKLRASGCGSAAAVVIMASFNVAMDSSRSAASIRAGYRGLEGPICARSAFRWSCAPLPSCLRRTCAPDARRRTLGVFFSSAGCSHARCSEQLWSADATRRAGDSGATARPVTCAFACTPSVIFLMR